MCALVQVQEDVSAIAVLRPGRMQLTPGELLAVQRAAQKQLWRLRSSWQFPTAPLEVLQKQEQEQEEQAPEVRQIGAYAAGVPALRRLGARIWTAKEMHAAEEFRRRSRSPSRKIKKELE